MSAAAIVPDPPTQPSRSARLLDLVRKLIDYGKELAATIRQHAFTEPDAVRRRFGTADAALILARICRGLYRANALEARLLSNADSLDSAPHLAASPSRPRAPRPAAAPATTEADPRFARPPSTGELDPMVAAEVRRRPIGAVIADICRDLGILPSHPLWRELQYAIIKEGGSLGRLFKDILDRAFPIPAVALARSPAQPQQIAKTACTGPP